LAVCGHLDLARVSHETGWFEVLPERNTLVSPVVA
jgi:hypothetical protein